MGFLALEPAQANQTNKWPICESLRENGSPKASHNKASQPHFPHFPRFRVRIFRIFRALALWGLLKPLFL